MRFAFLGALAALSLGLTACGPGLPTSPPAAGASPPVEAVAIGADKALIVAELSYNTAATALVKAVEVGLVKPGTPLAEQLRGYNRTASQALEVARAARSSAERASALATALTAVASLSQLTPRSS